MFMHLASLLWEKNWLSETVQYSLYSSDINATGTILLEELEANLFITSVWKSNFRYAAIIFDKFLYSEILRFKTTIFPDERTSVNPRKFNSSILGQNVLYTEKSEIKQFVIRVISDFKIAIVLESKE